MDRLGPDNAIASRPVEEHMRLFHQAVYQGCGFPHDAVLPMSYGDKRDWSYHPRWDDVDGQIDFALRHDREPVYRVAVAMPASLPPTAHGGKEDALAASALWADIDDSRGVHGAQELPFPSPEQAWEILQQYPLPPTGVMDTGGGLLAFWRVETFSPGSDAGQRLRQAHLRALEALHERLAVSFDPAVPMSAAPVTRCPAGVNGKARPVPGNGWSQERVALIRPDITTAPVRLVWLGTDEVYRADDLIAALGAAGLLEPKAAPRAPTERYHVCGGASPEERICVELPMARICREMSFVGPDDELIEWDDKENIPDDADDWSLTWSHERSGKTYAKLYYEPPAGHEDMTPVSALTCWGTGTADVFGTKANTGKMCTWKWLRLGYFRDARAAHNFVRRYAGRPDDAMATLVRYPRSADLLAAQATLSTPVVVASTVPGAPADVPAAAVAAKGYTSFPWKKRHTLTYTAGDITEWYRAHPATHYGVALDGAHLVVATVTEQLSVPLIDQAVDELIENTARGMKLYAYDASRTVRTVMLETGRRLRVGSTGAGARALGAPDRPTEPSGAREATTTALMAEALSQRGKWPAMAAQLDELWHSLAVDGILVDTKMLEKAAARSDGNQNKAVELLRAAHHDGRVRPIVNVYGAATGRMTIQGPALQNLHRDLKPALLADPGKALVGLDLVQVEPRVAAILSGDEAMRQAVAADAYVTAAQLIWPDRTVDRELRAKAKTVLISLLYGEGSARLAADLRVEQSKAKELSRALLSRWPRFKAWRDAVIAKAKAGRERVTIAGRPLPRLVAGEEYKAVNHVVQGSAADIFLQMTLRVAKALPQGARLWLAVHDELVVECRADDVDTTKQLLTEKMTLRAGDVTIDGDSVVYGERWGAI